MVERIAVDSFTEFFRETEPGLKFALCAAFGREVGVEAAAHALAYGWEHWERVGGLPNPAGYLWGVGRNRARRIRGRQRLLFASVPTEDIPWVEPGLPSALARLSERQRVAVILVHGVDWTYAEVADLLGISVPTVQKHTERALARLRRKLGATS